MKYFLHIEHIFHFRRKYLLILRDQRLEIKTLLQYKYIYIYLCKEEFRYEHKIKIQNRLKPDISANLFKH